MSDMRGLLFGALAVAGLAYCLWKTQADWRDGFSWTVAWGAAASLSAFFFATLIFASKVMRDL
jgi:hypothetical protein